MSTPYDKIERAYGPHLERDTENLIPGQEATEANFGVPQENDGAGTTAPTGGGGSEPVIKNESQFSDLWIQNTIKSLNWKPKKQGFYIDGATGYAEFANIFLAGGIEATTGNIGGWTIEADQLSSGNVKLQSTAERILMGAATLPATGTGIFLGLHSGAYKFRVGDPAAAYMLWDGTTLALQGGVVTSLGSGTDLAIMGWQSDLVFTADSQTQVSWSSGTLRFHNGINYSISAGNTGTMAALTYIYIDTAVSSTVLQITTTAATAIGRNKVIIAVAKNNAESGKLATFQAFGGAGGVSPFIGANQIAANSITANEIAANSITAAELAATLVYAGAITLDTNGHIKGGQTAYDTGTGFFLGYSGGTYKLSIGVGGASTENFKWDGARLIVNGYSQTGLGTYAGDGSDGALVVTGTTTLNAGQLYQYTSVVVQTGGVLKFTGNGIAQMLVQGNFEVQTGGIIELRYTTTTYLGGAIGIHALESGNTYFVRTTDSLGGPIQTIGTGGDGGEGGDGIGAGAGTGGTAGANSGTPTAGGTGGDGTTGTTGGGGGGGGGGGNTGGTAPTAGTAASGVNGGVGGNGGTPGATGVGGNGGSGGGGTGTGNGANGGDGGDGFGTATGGSGGNGGQSGATGGNGGNGGTGGDSGVPTADGANGGRGGNGGSGYQEGGNGGAGGDARGGSSWNGNGGRGGDGGAAFLGTGGDGGNGGSGSDQGTGGRGGDGGDGFTGGDGGNGGTVTNAVSSATGGAGGDGGNAYSGAIPLFVFAGGNITITGTINAFGGNGGDGGDGGSCPGNPGTAGSGGDGGDGADGADVYLLCKGTFTKTGNIFTFGGRGGTAGRGGYNSNRQNFGTAGRSGKPGRGGRAVTGTIVL